MKILAVVGARPNFMKIAPLMWELKRRRGVASFLVHTGQHYDERMSDIFFVQLGLPEPDINLGVGSGTQATQTADVLVGMERAVREMKDAMRVT